MSEYVDPQNGGFLLVSLATNLKAGTLRTARPCAGFRLGVLQVFSHGAQGPLVSEHQSSGWHMPSRALRAQHPSECVCPFVGELWVKTRESHDVGPLEIHFFAGVGIVAECDAGGPETKPSAARFFPSFF